MKKSILKIFIDYIKDILKILSKYLILPIIHFIIKTYIDFFINIKNIIYYFVKNIKTIQKKFTAFLYIILSIFLSFIIIVSIIYYCKEIKRETIIIEPFDVPKELENIGLTDENISNSLINQIYEIKNYVEIFPLADFEFKPIYINEISKESYNVELKGTKISIK